MAKEAQKMGESTMQLAELLSDLVSLRVCEPTAALALVSARPNVSSASTSKPSDPNESEEDADLKRAKDLVELHYAVKEAHKRGELGHGLMEARQAVSKAVGG